MNFKLYLILNASPSGETMCFYQQDNLQLPIVSQCGHMGADHQLPMANFSKLLHYNYIYFEIFSYSVFFFVKFYLIYYKQMCTIIICTKIVKKMTIHK